MKKTKNTEKGDDVMQARALLIEEEVKRKKDFHSEYEKLCQKHKMQIVSAPNLSIERIS